MEKYTKGKEINGRDAIGRMLKGEVVFRNCLPARLSCEGEFQALDRGLWFHASVGHGNRYFEAIKEPVYNLTFAEAMAYLRGGVGREVQSARLPIRAIKLVGSSVMIGKDYFTLDTYRLDDKYAVIA